MFLFLVERLEFFQGQSFWGKKRKEVSFPSREGRRGPGKGPGGGGRMHDRAAGKGKLMGGSIFVTEEKRSARVGARSS